MELWVGKVLLREDLSLILHALRIIDEFANVARLNFLPLVLLRDYVLLNSFIDNLIVIATILYLLLHRGPVLHRAHHVIIRDHQVFIILSH